MGTVGGERAREEERETERVPPSVRDRRPVTAATVWRLGVVYVLAFVALRTAGSLEPVALGAARLLFAGAVAVTLAGTMRAWRSSRGSGDAWTWTFLVAMLATLLVGHVWLNATRAIMGPEATFVPSVPSGFDVANLVAGGFLLAAAASRVTFGRAEPLVRARRVADTTGTMAVVFAVGYATFSRVPGTPTTDIVLSALYVASGVGVLAVATMLFVGYKRAAWTDWEKAFAAALVVYGWALVGYPVWRRVVATPRLEGIEVLIEASLLAGHVALLASSTLRASDGLSCVAYDRSSAWIGRLGPSMSFALTASSISVIAVPVLGSAALSAPRGSSHALVYFAAAAVSCVAMVTRTSIAGLETGMLRVSAERDALTGVLDPGTARARLAEWVRTATRYDEHLSIVVFDLDDFGVVNTLYGVEEGDRLIAHAAEALSAVLRPGMLGRLGGDEFVAVVDGADRRTALRVAEEMRTALANVLTASGLPLTASWGTATCPDDADGAEGLIIRADSAQHWAKHHGKDRVVQYEASSLGVLDEVSRFIRGEEGDERAMLVAVSRTCDQYLDGRPHHARNVAALSVLVARRLGLDGSDVQDIELAALVHDIGRIAIGVEAHSSRRRAVPCTGSDEECHPVVGAAILDSTSFSRLAPVVRAHHERWDGTGHPDGLRGAEIPLATRIVSACDALERLTAGSAGRRPLSRAAALHELDQRMGTAFDPVVTEALIEVVGESTVLGWKEEPAWR